MPGVEKAIVESGIILIKYWLEVSEEEQTRRLEARINDGRKIWKLSPMDLKSYSRWYDYSRARDDDVQGDRHRLGAVVRRALRRQAAGAAQRHQPTCWSRSRTRRLPRDKVKLPKRQRTRDYVEPDYPTSSFPNSPGRQRGTAESRPDRSVRT